MQKLEYPHAINQGTEDAKDAGAQIELVNLYDLEYKGCIGCLACKGKNNKSFGHCAVNDGLKPVLDKIDKSNGLISGSPIYLSDVTAMMRSFLERLIFQYLSYDNYSEPYFNGNLRTAFIYTMNVSESMLTEIGYDKLFKRYETVLSHYFNYTETLLSTETLQVNDYSKYHMAHFNEVNRKKRREDVFPNDCKIAYGLGKSLAKG